MKTFDKVIIYDSNPGSGSMNKFLAISWAVWARVLGFIFKYKVLTWNEASQFAFHANSIKELQIWCHGSPGVLWLGNKPFSFAKIDEIPVVFKLISSCLRRDSLIWFRCCSFAQGFVGFRAMVNAVGLFNCKVAAHTRIIGVFQSGLHSMTRETAESWQWTSEKESECLCLRRLGLTLGNNLITCFQHSFSKNW